MRNSKIDCLDRMFKLAQNMGELVNFLYEEKLITKSDVEHVGKEPDKARTVYEILQRLKEEDKLLLLDYEWIILPIERIKVSIVTEAVAREFTYRL